jgi:uncharacterized protein YndB with AHSA1/START domain
MKKILKSIVIEASRETVWAAIINDQKYRLWTAAFEPTSHFVGGWQQGESIKFLMKDEQGQLKGMLAEIASSEHLRRISIHMLGLTDGDSVDFDSDEAKKWVPSYENYELEAISPNMTRFCVDADVNEAFFDHMTDAWTKALNKLKEVCEQNLAPFISIAITTEVQASMDKVWRCWTDPACIKKWNHALDSWHCPAASNDLSVGGRYVYTMASTDGKMSFDFSGTYTEVVQHERITSQLDDGRMVWVSFESVGPNSIKVMEKFEAENENALELQRNGWQAILDNFKRVAEDEKE